MNKLLALFGGDKKSKFDKVFAWVLVVGGIIGLLASAILTIEKIHLAQDPNYIPSCSISPIVSCSPVIGSRQASAFGFPNPLLGLAGFAMVWAVGMMIFAGAKKLKDWFWWCFQAGTTFGMLFIAWLAYNSLYEIGKLCLYCMIVWAVTIPIFFTTLSYNLKNNHIKLKGKIADFIRDDPGKLTAISYLLIAMLIIFKFSDYFKTWVN